MTKKEFLDKLRIALNGKVHYSVIQENIEYYETYISMQVRKGRMEEEVLAELGDPRLLAKTIIEAQKHGGRDMPEEGNFAEEEQEGFFSGMRRKIASLPGWVLLILIVLVPILCTTVLSVAFSAIFSILGPILIPLLLLLLAIRLIQKMR
ncbi:MAG: DUF1700 domain-containing protein [Lachnospiraceae bacterium]|nr:DUF1700 domain-containing protein [Lachnospiraceae bacterium]